MVWKNSSTYSFSFKIMQKFIIKSFIFIIGFWLLSVPLAAFADRLSPMNVYSESEADRIKNLLQKRDIITAISIGNSHSGAIDFDTFGVDGQILARAGTDLFEVNQYAKSVVPRIPQLRTVFIAISYFSFYRNNLIFKDTRNLRIELYAMLPTWKPLPGDFEYLFLGKIHKYFRTMSIVRPDNWHDVFTAASEGQIKEDPLSNNLVQSITPWGTCTHYNQKDLTDIGNEIGFKAADNHMKMYTADPNIREESFQALADTIQLFKDKNIRIILFTPPYHISYNNRFLEIAPDMVKHMSSTMEKLSEEYDVEYYNAASLPEFSTHPELFFNSDHLNECGCRAFSEYLLSQMKNH